MFHPNDLKILPAWELSERETDIVSLVASGQSNAEISGTLGIAEATVKHLLSVSIAGKMGFRRDDKGGSLRVRMALRAHGII